MDKIKFTVGNHIMIGEIEHRILNSRYEHGKPYNYNVKNGGYTYKFSGIAVDTAEYIDVYMEVDSKSFHEIGIQYIDDTEYRTLMRGRAEISPKRDSDISDLDYDASDLLPWN